jgi:hypothetical protein
MATARDLRAELTSALLLRAVEMNDLPDTDPDKQKMRLMSDTFTAAVDFLRSQFPNDSIRALMAMVWDLVGHRVAPVVFGPDVPTLSFAAVQRGDVESAVIIMPHQWLERVKVDVVNETGAIVFVGSQAVDFYNDRIRDRTAMRGAAYEAEYLLTAKKLSPSYVFNEYQRGVLEDFPEGLASEKASSIVYPRKAFARPENAS